MLEFDISQIILFIIFLNNVIISILIYDK